MADKKPAFKKGIAPEGPIVGFSNLIRPDFGNEKVQKPDGEYKVNVAYSDDECKAIRDTVEELTANEMAVVKTKLEKQLAEAKTGQDKKKIKDAIEKLNEHFPWTEGVDDDGNEDGSFILTFNTKARFKDSKTQVVRDKKLPLFDCSMPKPKEIKPEAIWSGSIVKPAFDYMPYYVGATGMVGVKLRLNAVQIVKLVQGGGGGDASSYGFGGSEDGYQADDADAGDHGFDGDGSGDDRPAPPDDDNPNF
ncbi:hypothetical protein [Aquabacterium sp.]|uniref:hypothetical protein n=1 Tax=Aquabacterium sp. TaxID=1872578 RepID=UPI004038394D